MKDLALSRDQAEALYDAAISVMSRKRTYGHLYDAAITLRLETGMSRDHSDAVYMVNHAIDGTNLYPEEN